MIDQLFVVVHERFLRGELYLGIGEPDREARLDLSAKVSLVAVMDDLRWPAGMKTRIAAIITSFHSREVFVIIHKWCCNDLGWYRVNNVEPHLRLPEAELELIAAIHSGNPPARLEVFGFHLEPGRSLTDALALVRSKPGEFVMLVSSILESSDPSTLFDRLSVVKHRIVGLFLPLDLTLQNWTESGDQKLRAEVDSRLRGKLESAHHLLEEAHRIIEDGGRSARIEGVRMLLETSQVVDSAQTAVSFHAWIGRLDQAIDEIRKCVSS